MSVQHFYCTFIVLGTCLRDFGSSTKVLVTSKEGIGRVKLATCQVDGSGNFDTFARRHGAHKVKVRAEHIIKSLKMSKTLFSFSFSAYLTLTPSTLSLVHSSQGHSYPIRAILVKHLTPTVLVGFRGNMTRSPGDVFNAATSRTAIDARKPLSPFHKKYCLLTP